MKIEPLRENNIQGKSIEIFFSFVQFDSNEREREKERSNNERRRKKRDRSIWRCRASIPVPLACKASALPSELHPRDFS